MDIKKLRVSLLIFLVAFSFLGTGCQTLQRVVDETRLPFISKWIADKKKKRAFKKLKTKAPPKIKAPYLTKPLVRMYWVPDEIRGNKYIEGHRVWVLKSKSAWTKTD